jgi:hypothetical protein
VREFQPTLSGQWGEIWWSKDLPAEVISPSFLEILQFDVEAAIPQPPDLLDFPPPCIENSMLRLHLEVAPVVQVQDDLNRPGFTGDSVS